MGLAAGSATRSSRRARSRRARSRRARSRLVSVESRARQQKRKVGKKVVEDDGEILVGDVGVGVDGGEKVDGVEKVDILEKKGFKDKIELKRSK